MRHYDRAGFRHLDDAERYRDPEYMGDDGWVGPNEHGNWANDERQGRAGGRLGSRPFPGYGQRPASPSYVGRGPRRGPPSRERTGLIDALLHPRLAMQRVVRGLFGGKSSKGWARSERRIQDDVCEALAQHRDVDASDIEVHVKEGEVTLSGTVADRRMKYLADDMAAEVLGVKDVHNGLKVVVRR